MKRCFSQDKFKNAKKGAIKNKTNLFPVYDDCDKVRAALFTIIENERQRQDKLWAKAKKKGKRPDWAKAIHKELDKPSPDKNWQALQVACLAVAWLEDLLKDIYERA